MLGKKKSGENVPKDWTHFYTDEELRQRQQLPTILIIVKFTLALVVRRESQYVSFDHFQETVERAPGDLLAPWSLIEIKEPLRRCIDFRSNPRYILRSIFYLLSVNRSGSAQCRCRWLRAFPSELEGATGFDLTAEVYVCPFVLRPSVERTWRRDCEEFRRNSTNRSSNGHPLCLKLKRAIKIPSQRFLLST